MTEINLTTGEESVCVQPKILLKTEDGMVVGTVPVVMLPVKRGSQCVSEAVKKVKGKGRCGYEDTCRKGSEAKPRNREH